MIDLDTVMPGLAMNDFGDSIRFGASTAAEDERDLSLVSCSMELFDIYARGYIEGCGGKLTEREILELPMGAKTMTYECGMRFLLIICREILISRSTEKVIIWIAAVRSLS